MSPEPTTSSSAVPMSSSQTTITITAADLAAVLGTTVPFAGAVGYGLPSLEAVQLSAGNGLLVGAATNRYVIGYARQPATAARPVRFLLGVSQARAVRNTLMAAMDERETGQFEVAIVITDEAPKRSAGFYFEPYTMTFEETVGAGSFPDLGKILGEQVQPGTKPEPGPVGLNPTAIKPFIKAAKWAKDQPLRWSFGDAMKPARVEIDDWFVGLIMPVRLPDKQQPVECVMPFTEAVSAR
jgi:hypothetical protein